jgi:V/A-type H+-transporting ATPase subunit K
MVIEGLGDYNLSVLISGIGSAVGCGIAGLAAIGAWKKAYAANKVAPFILVAFVGMPLSQVIFGMILRNAIIAAKMPAELFLVQMYLGGAAGIVLAICSFVLGLCGAKACDAMVETGKGAGNYIMVLGVIETVSLFVMVFCMTALPKAAAVAAAAAPALH